MAGTTTTTTRAMLVLGVILIAVVALLPGAAHAAVAPRAVASAGGVRAFWTPARMRAAQPLGVEAPGLAARESQVAGGSGASPTYVPRAAPADPVAARLRSGTSASERGLLPSRNRDEITDPSAPKFRAHGKVFITIDGTDYVCSGTAVNSRNRSVVWTAGHCVFDAATPGEAGTNQYVTNFLFVPAYHEGDEPYGEWPAKRVATTNQWRTGGNLRFDVGAAVVRRVGGLRLQSVVGARGIGFDQPRGEVLQAIGYPAEPPPLAFDGKREFRCTGKPFGTDDRDFENGPEPIGIRCDMTAGSSGGGWIAGNTLVSQTSYGYIDETGHLYGPYLSRAAKTLYRSVRGGRKKHRHHH
jgi:hypothetical protein